MEICNKIFIKGCWENAMCNYTYLNVRALYASINTSADVEFWMGCQYRLSPSQLHFYIPIAIGYVVYVGL